MNLSKMLRGLAYLLLLLGTLTIISIYFVIVLVDWLQWFPMPEQLQWQIMFDGRLFADWPQLLMIYFFQEAGTVEQIQYRLLFAASALSLLLVVTALERGMGRKLILGLGFLTFGLVLMYINDAYNFRHWIADELGFKIYGSLLEPRDWIRIAIELVFYILVAVFMVTFAVIFWLQRSHFPQTFRLLFSAYVCYFAASVASVSRYVGNWYDWAGQRIAVFLPEHILNELRRIPLEVEHHPYYFWLTDWVIEETIEYIGALCFVVALLLLLSEILVLKKTHQDYGDKQARAR